MTDTNDHTKTDHTNTDPQKKTDKTDHTAGAVCNIDKPASLSQPVSSSPETAQHNSTTHHTVDLYNTSFACADNLGSWIDLLNRLGSFSRLITVLKDGLQAICERMGAQGAKLSLLFRKDLTTITTAGDGDFNIASDRLTGLQQRLPHYAVFPLHRGVATRWLVILKHCRQPDKKLLAHPSLGFFHCALAAYIQCWRPDTLDAPPQLTDLTPAQKKIKRQFPSIITAHPGMLDVLVQIETFARTHFPILIQGESGTGKELVAQAIHARSRRARRPLIIENCAAIPDSLLEAEFFGVNRGAYTGAYEDRPGLLRMAHQSSLFLDEIGEMSPPLQKKLLRVLQEQVLRRVGANSTELIDIRLISATNRPLKNLVEAGIFRRDLFFRLNIVTINLPPLREREEDIPLLARCFLNSFNGKYRKNKAPIPFGPDTIQILCRYRWPGNIRELQNEIFKSAVLAEDGPILPHHLSDHLALASNGISARDLMQGCANLLDYEQKTVGNTIKKILHTVDGNKAACAKALGIPKTSLYHRLKRYKL